MRLISPSVCAVVVTFHPQEEILDNLIQAMPQTQALVVVDNGSGVASLEMLRTASSEYGFALIENGSSLGIAAALNRGIEWAKERSYQWVLLLDQDSTVSEGFVEAMFAGYDEHLNPHKVAILCPKYIDRRSGRLMPAAREKDGGLTVARTSGSLIPMRIFEECGPFVEELIIDQVDYEHSLDSGNAVMSSQSAQMRR